jgi:pimeloyl-ACP methyl ester carboxylesterase
MDTQRSNETRKARRARGDGVEALTLHANGLKFSALEQGEGTEVVFCLHGFPDHARSFRAQLPALAQAGYRVIVPTLRGYEPSSQPYDRGYHLIQLAQDVLGWMDCVGVRKVHLVGHDWGALIGYTLAAMEPERFQSLVTLAVPHPQAAIGGLLTETQQLRNSWYSFFFQLRLVSDVALRWNDFQLIEKLWRDWSPGWDWPAEEMEALKRTFRQPGVARAALGYYRDFFRLWSPTHWRTQKVLARPIGVPTLALTGVKDGCVSTRLFERMKPENFTKGLRIERVADAGHFLHQERPEEVNRLLLEWLGQHRD